MSTKLAAILEFLSGPGKPEVEDIEDFGRVPPRVVSPFLTILLAKYQFPAARLRWIAPLVGQLDKETWITRFWKYVKNDSKLVRLLLKLEVQLGNERFPQAEVTRQAILSRFGTLPSRVTGPMELMFRRMIVKTNLRRLRIPSKELLRH